VILPDALIRISLLIDRIDSSAETTELQAKTKVKMG